MSARHRRQARIRRRGRQIRHAHWRERAYAAIRRRERNQVKNERRKSRPAVEAFDRAAGVCDNCQREGPPLAYYRNGLVLCPDCLRRWRSLEAS